MSFVYHGMILIEFAARLFVPFSLQNLQKVNFLANSENVASLQLRTSSENMLVFFRTSGLSQNSSSQWKQRKKLDFTVAIKERNLLFVFSVGETQKQRISDEILGAHDTCCQSLPMHGIFELVFFWNNNFYLMHVLESVAPKKLALS